MIEIGEETNRNKIVTHLFSMMKNLQLIQIKISPKNEQIEIKNVSINNPQFSSYSKN